LTTCPGTIAAVELKDLLNSLAEQLRKKGERDIINAVPGRKKKSLV
jgi:hypothetical protein